jgi:hypothetical protein
MPARGDWFDPGLTITTMPPGALGDRAHMPLSGHALMPMSGRTVEQR